MQRTLTTIHLLLAAFLLPIALMFATTGALYTVSIKGNYVETSRTLELSAPLTPELSSLTQVAEGALAAEGVEVPSATCCSSLPPTP